LHVDARNILTAVMNHIYVNYAGDSLFVHELCNKVMGVEVGTGDIEKMFRLGKREQGKDRPLLIRFGNEGKKRDVMAKAKELKQAPKTFRKISMAHDLTPRQRETVKEVRNKALEELNAENGTYRESDGKRGNFRIIVVGQQTNKPRAVRVPMNY